MKLRTGFRNAVACVASAALAASMCVPAAAFAGQAKVSNQTNWNAPTSPMTNTVEVGNKLYKVTTTWANAWALSGPDYIGVSNSGALNQQGGGGGSTTLKNAQQETLLGIWASAANEVPNAYNWNFFYDLYAAQYGTGEEAPFSVVDTANGASGNFDTTTGVYSPFKYRPEIIWTSNSLSAADAVKYAGYIKDKKYYTSNDDAGKEGKNVSDISRFKLYKDDDYNPDIMSATNASSFGFSGSLYELAGYAEGVKEATKDYDGKGYSSTAYSGGIDTVDQVTANNVTWRNMNALPRTTRYEASAEAKTDKADTATNAALAFEKVTKGSIYYTLAKITDKTVEKKKVAWLTGDPDSSGDTATIAVFDFVDSIGMGADNGYAGIAPLAVTQLGENFNPKNAKSKSAVSKGYGTSYATYTVTCDQLADCDFVFLTSGGGTNGTSGFKDETALKNWIINNTTNATKRAAAQDIQCAVTAPPMMNAHNYTIEKTLFGLYNLCFIYPDLFPDMELLTYYYDVIYHLKKSELKTALGWALANVSMPNSDNCSLTRVGATNIADDMEKKFKEGIEYYNQSSTSDDVLKNLVGEKTTGRFTQQTGLNFSSIEPTNKFLFFYNLSTKKELDANNVTIELEKESFEYTGDAIESGVVKNVTYKENSSSTGVVLTANKDYALTYTNNTSVAASNKATDAPTVTVVGRGDYTGAVKKTFSITQADLSGATVELDQDDYAIGATPKATVTLGSGKDKRTLSAGGGRGSSADYKITASNNTAAGTAAWTITGQGNYKGTTSGTFTVAADSLGGATVEFALEKANNKYTTEFTGSRITPAVTVKVNGSEITNENGENYTVSYSNNTNVGTATATVSGVKYTGTASGTFEITAKSLEAATVSLNQTYPYTGKVVEPTPTVKLGNTTLKAGTDFTLSYKRSAVIGTAQCTVTGTGNYKGSVSKNYVIDKAAQSIKASASGKTFKYKKVKKKAQTVGTVKVTGASGAVTFAKSAGSGKLSVNAKTGKITLAKKAKKGKHTITVKVSAAGTSLLKAGETTVKVTVKVK